MLPKRWGTGSATSTRFSNAHKTVRCGFFCLHHPWFGREVFVHIAIEKTDGVFYRCTLDGSAMDRWLEIPAWMFDRAGCAEGLSRTAAPFVSLDALAALTVLLDQALRNGQAPSNAPLWGARTVSRDQNRGEAHGMQDGDVGATGSAQSAARSASDGSVRSQRIRRHGRHPLMAGSATGGAGCAERCGFSRYFRH